MLLYLEQVTDLTVKGHDLELSFRKNKRAGALVVYTA
jgi:hypothetical protein